MRVYHNTFVDTPASFERNERSATGRPLRLASRAPVPTWTSARATSSSNNLLVASESFRKPLLRFEQPKALCAQLTRPQVKELDGNVYVRAGTGRAPLLVWSPVAGENCQVELALARGAAEAAAGVRGRAAAFASDEPGALFRSPELHRFDLARLLPGLSSADDLPAEVRRLLGWREEVGRAPGAFPFRPQAVPAGERGPRSR